MAADDDDNKVNGNGVTGDDDGYVNNSQINYIVNLFTL